MPLTGLEAVASDSKKVSKIADLIAYTDGDGRPDSLGETVTVKGRATVGTNVLNDQYLLFYMQDNTAGIMIFSETMDISISIGDSLQVTGTLELHATLHRCCSRWAETKSAIPAAHSQDRLKLSSHFNKVL